MSYKYILKFRENHEQIITIEAWPRLKTYATDREIRKPSFIIGTVKGSRTVMLFHHIEDSMKKYNSIKKGSFTIIHYPPEDPDAINDAYRLGLAATVIDNADDSHSADTALRYVMQSTKEEIWFWTSKLLGVVGDKIDKDRVLMAIHIMSGGKSLSSFSSISETIKRESPSFQTKLF